MRFSPIAFFITLITAVQSCLVLDGYLTITGTMIVTLTDNGSTKCAWSGNNYAGQAQGLNCVPGFAAWVQVSPVNKYPQGSGVAAYSTGNGAHSYRFAVTGTFTDIDGMLNYPLSGIRWNPSARNYC